MNKTKHKQINPVSKHPVDNYLEWYGNLGISCHSISADDHSFDFFQDIHCMTKAECMINTSWPYNCWDAAWWRVSRCCDPDVQAPAPPSSQGWSVIKNRKVTDTVTARHTESRVIKVSLQCTYSRKNRCKNQSNIYFTFKFNCSMWPDCNILFTNR